MADTPIIPPTFDIVPVTIEEEMKRSYLDYAMSVIVARALPDVRDGLKPVHRRIFYAMKDGGYDSSKPFKKSARIVGDVMGKYHPHGDQAIYDAMVRMAQVFSMRLPLIDGQGNFGSMDGDPPAHMRYTEARLAKTAEALLEDIDQETVDFVPTYDETSVEPVVLPSRFPNLLVNGANGIAVGMATNIPTHNLGEVIDACCLLIDDPAATLDQLLEVIPGPDFPTGGIILGRAGIREAMATGRGSITVRSKTHIEEIRRDREAIIVSEVPYMQNKAQLVQRIAHAVNEKTVEGIGEMRDESDRDGVRIVLELKRDAVAEVVLAQLYKFTPLQTSFGVNMLAIDGRRPETLDLKRILQAFLTHREQVIRRRTAFRLTHARRRAHVLVGLAVAVANLDRVIATIRQAPDPGAAREALMTTPWAATEVAPLIALVDEPDRPVDADGNYRLSEEQAKAILDLRLHRLTGLEREKIGGDLETLVREIGELLEILTERRTLLDLMRRELIDIKERFADPRRTEIQDVEFESDIEALIQREDMVVTFSHAGYVKRVALSTYRAQRRGGKGRAGMATKEEDVVSDVFVASTHTPVLFFSSRGIVYRLKVYRLPIGTPQARGKALVNLLPLQPGETITAIMPLPEDEDSWGGLQLMFATASGQVRRNQLSDFQQINRNGKIAMKLDEGDRLIAVSVCNDDQDVLLATRLGKCIRFPVTDVRVFSGRTSTGVRGIRMMAGDRVISMSMLKHGDATAEERRAYLKLANAARQAEGEETDGEDEIETTAAIELTTERYAQLAADEEIILTVSVEGYGKRSSSYGYRLTSRGGVGIWNMTMGERNSAIAACFPVTNGQQIILITDGGQVIRVPVDGIRIAARKTMGVRVFNVAEGESVVSVAAVDEETEADNGAEPEGEGGQA